MTEYVKWMPYTHGDQPPHWTKDMLASVDEDGEKVNADWAWLAWSTYYVPYEAVHGKPFEAALEVRNNCEAQAKTIEALQADNAKLREALVSMRQAAAGFALSVRDDNGMPYPWPALDIADAQAEAALQETGQ